MAIINKIKVIEDKIEDVISLDKLIDKTRKYVLKKNISRIGIGAWSFPVKYRVATRL